MTSDHGAARVIDTYKLDDYVNATWYIKSGESPNLMFLPTSGKYVKFQTNCNLLISLSALKSHVSYVILIDRMSIYMYYHLSM